MVAAFAVTVGFLIGGAMLARWSHRGRGEASLLGPALPIGASVAVLIAAQWGTFAMALPLIATVGVVVGMAAVQGDARHRGRPGAAVTFLMMAAFALTLLLKMGLNARIDHYGFYLALPATVVLVMLGCWSVPTALSSSGQTAAGRTVRQMVIGALTVSAALHLALADRYYRDKTLAIGSGTDRFLTAQTEGLWQGVGLRDALQELRSVGGRHSFTLAVLPEGVMLNYLLRVRSPLAVVTAMPPELLIHGESRLLAPLMSNPPDFIAIVAKDTSEYGFERFGTDVRYGLRTMQWISAHYRHRTTVAGRGPNTGIEIFERAFRDPENTPPPAHPQGDTTEAGGSRPPTQAN